MRFSALSSSLLVAAAALQTTNAVLQGSPKNLIRQTSTGLQDIVTWDEHSIFVRGERVMFMSGEYHPFRLPSMDLWLDVFQKIKALGYTGVSFYVNWALLEGTPGVFRSEGVFALEPFFDAASEAGIYLLARPGPYINAEASGGGYPGWLNRVEGPFRTNATSYLEATDYYCQQVGQIIAKAQITNGGPVILFQPENEYTYPANNITFPNVDYFRYVEEQFLKAGIVVPLISNDAGPLGYFAPGNESYAPANVDIYGHDGYPLGFNCQQPYNWTDNKLPTNWRRLHEQQSPSSAYMITEFQGGSFDPWGGYGFDNCATLTNEQFERIFFKNNWSFGVTLFNVYMKMGGTNWGNLGHPLGYTSYDYGAAISEDRSTTRAKYSEDKLAANFLRCSPTYLTSIPQNGTNGSYASTSALAVTQLLGGDSKTNLYIVRHAAYNSLSETEYQFTVDTSNGSITIPQLSTFSGHLNMNGRDSKVHVTDYDLNGTNLLYSTGEIFTWQKYDSETVLVLYGDANETHEFALAGSGCNVTSGDSSSVSAKTRGGYTVVQWQVTPASKQVQIGNVKIYLLWRQVAYNWWSLELPAASPIANYTSPSKQSVIIGGGYLMRTAQLQNGDLHLTGDINATVTIEIAGAPEYNKVFFNGNQVSSPTFEATYTNPDLNLPELSLLDWRSIDSLPEISSTYSDAAWTIANRTNTTNQFRPTTAEVLYASDYGYHNGPLLYRGHFSTSDSSPLSLSLYTQGGQSYGYSVYLNSNLLYQYPGISTSQNDNRTFTLSNLTANSDNVVTLVIDHLGLTENFNPGNDTMKEPRGLLSYNLTSSSTSVPMTWKLTGNLGGEDYQDLTRGPLNEAGMYFERQGYHLPNAPTNSSSWTSLSPLTGYSGSGIRFFATSFNLDLPTPQYDIPLAFAFTNTTTTTDGGRALRFRTNLYVNGWQFGRYVNHIGPQTVYPVPQGILNYGGENYVGVSIWSLEEEDTEVMLGGLELVSSSTPVLTGYGKQVRLSYSLPQDGWKQREGAY